MKYFVRVKTLVRYFLRVDIKLLTMKSNSRSSSSSEPPAKKGFWRDGLLDSMKDPESVMKEDERIVIIKDKYPKAHHHYLVLPKEDIHSIHQVGKEHEELLKHMEEMGQKLADEQKGYEFLLGYHAVPSMHRLHLHVISTDFDSPCLKNKYHWNSFTTPFFRLSKIVREELREHGHIKKMPSSENDEYLKKELQCYKCSVKQKNIPTLKKHLLTHLPGK